jgi:hypothetical protein
MNRPFIYNVIPQGLVLAGLLLAGAGIANAQNQAPDANSPAAPAGQRTDGQIEMDVVHALDASAALKDDLITAATIQGTVSLSGTVSTDASKQLAESLVAHVPGVVKVTNNLTVGNPQDAQNGPPPQEDNQADEQAPAPSDGQMQAQAPPQQQAPYAGQDQQGQYQNQGQYPDQGQANGQPPAPYPPARPQYAPAPYPPAYPPQGQYAQGPPPAPQYKEPTGPVTVAQGTLLQLRTSESLDNKRAKDGTPVQFTVIRDVAVNGVLAIPKGATVHGVVTESKKAGDLGGSPELALKLTSLDLGGHSYDLDSDQFKVKGPNKAGQTVGSAVGGGILGTIIGCAVGRGVGCAVGAGAGVAAGTAASAASPGPRAWIPAEALVTFHLNTPVTVDPVSSQEAARLAEGLYQGGPNLYRRGPYGYGYGPGPAPAYYAGAYPYGPVYYRPYYVVGGEYYWR